MSAAPTTSPGPPIAAVRTPRRGRVLGPIARLLAWPLAFVVLLLGLGLRLLGLALRLLHRLVAAPIRRRTAPPAPDDADRGRDPAGGVAGTLAAATRALARGPPAESVVESRRRIRRYGAQALAYLALRSERFPALVGPVAEPGAGRGPWDEARRRLRRDRTAMLSWIGILLYLYVALLCALGWIATDHDQGNPDAVYHPPTLSLRTLTLGDHPLGTDFLGREVWKRTVQGTMNALWIGTLAAALACAIGLVLGALSGYFGRIVDEIVVWFYTTLASIPYLLLMLALSFAFKSNPAIRTAYEGSFLFEGVGMSLGLFTIVLAVGLTFWVGVCRIVRAEFIKLRELDYVTAAKSLGIPTRRVIFRHIAPNVFHLVLIQFSLLFMSAIKFEVILSFLGVGMEEGDASWGQMITQAKIELMRADPVWWQITAATVAMFGLLLCVNLFTDALRDALDPRLRD